MAGFSYPRWFDARFAEVRDGLEGRLFDLDGAGVPEHEELGTLRKARRRFRDTLALLEPELAAPEGLRLCDVGGGHVAWLAAARFEGRATVLDLGGAYAEFARELGVETHRWDVAGTAPPPVAQGSFDVVTFTEVLEHLPPPPFEPVQRVASLLRPGGVLVVSVPNLAAFWKRVKFALFGRSPLKLGDTRHERAGFKDHLREYTLAEMRTVLARTGLTIEKTRAGDYGHYPWRHATTWLHRALPQAGLGRTLILRARRAGTSPEL